MDMRYISSRDLEFVSRKKSVKSLEGSKWACLEISKKNPTTLIPGSQYEWIRGLIQGIFYLHLFIFIQRIIFQFVDANTIFYWFLTKIIFHVARIGNKLVKWMVFMA